MNLPLSELDALKQSLDACEKRFSKVFDASPSMIAISTVENGHHYAVNDAWLNTMGYEREEVIGKTAHEMGVWLKPEDRERYIKAFQAQGYLRNYEHQLRTRNGDVRMFSTSCEEILFDGQPRLLMVFNDITDRKAAEQRLLRVNEDLERQVAERTRELQRQIEATEQAKAELEDSELRLMEANRMLNVVLDTIPVRVFWKDKNLNLLGCNRLFAMDAGYQNPRQMIGKSDFEMGWRDQAELYRADDMHVIESMKPKIGYEEPQTTPKGGEVWLRTSKSPLRNLDGDVIGVLGMYEDITDRKTAEKELQRAKQEAERANQAKSQFLSSMSHELRTPLNAILGFAQLMEHDPRHPLLDAQKESIEHIKTGGNHLLHLINEILELAKIESGHLELDLKSTKPEDVFYETVPMVQTLAEKNGLTFHVPALEHAWPHIWVDAMRLKQVLLNLLSNAVKYNVDSGSFTLACKVIDHALRIQVSDTGHGISAAGLKELFHPFSRLEHENSDIEGAGIGLTITKELVELMGGRIGVESTPGEGSTFWVEFPIAADNEVGAQVASKPENQHWQGGHHVGTVLYVEDNDANLMLMEGIFEQFPNLRLLTAKNAEIGLEMVEAEQPDFIMLDIALPGMSGTDLLKIIRERDKDASVIAVSAHAMPHLVQEGLDAGFDAYLTKPFNIGQLVAELERVFGEEAVQA
ncbi:PAS domain S-box protein [Magnetovibrio sp.]|uniref:hybrid sensor histidine kinase/response regulator n=1 Tax=Magnetovibrio sp. TaxID=2024836 RepID=UPI002F92F684